MKKKTVCTRAKAKAHRLLAKSQAFLATAEEHGPGYWSATRAKWYAEAVLANATQKAERCPDIERTAQRGFALLRAARRFRRLGRVA